MINHLIKQTLVVPASVTDIFFNSSMEMGQHITPRQMEVLLMDMSNMPMVMQMAKQMA